MPKEKITLLFMLFSILLLITTLFYMNNINKTKIIYNEKDIMDSLNSKSSKYNNFEFNKTLKTQTATKTYKCNIPQKNITVEKPRITITIFQNTNNSDKNIIKEIEIQTKAKYNVKTKLQYQDKNATSSMSYLHSNPNTKNKTIIHYKMEYPKELLDNFVKTFNADKYNQKHNLTAKYHENYAYYISNDSAPIESEHVFNKIGLPLVTFVILVLIIMTTLSLIKGE